MGPDGLGEHPDRYIFKEQPGEKSHDSSIVYVSGEQDIQKALSQSEKTREFTHPDPEILDEALGKGADPRLLSESAAREIVKLRFHQSVTEYFHGLREEQAILGQEKVEFAEDAFENMGRFIFRHGFSDNIISA